MTGYPIRRNREEDFTIFIERGKARNKLKELGVNLEDPIKMLALFRDEEKVMEIVRRLKLEAFE